MIPARTYTIQIRRPRPDCVNEARTDNTVLDTPRDDDDADHVDHADRGADDD